MLQEAPRATAGNGGVTGVKDPSGCPGVMRPAPVMNTDMTEPRGAGFDGELTEPSWFRTAACPLPVAFDVPQLHGMYHGDRSRKEVLVAHGFRMPSALDNRPLTFEEFEHRVTQVIYVSATPGPYELTKAAGVVVEQIIRRPDR